SSGKKCRAVRPITASKLGGGRFRVTLLHLAVATYRATVIATDPAGNRQAKARRLTFRAKPRDGSGPLGERRGAAAGGAGGRGAQCGSGRRATVRLAIAATCALLGAAAGAAPAGAIINPDTDTRWLPYQVALIDSPFTIADDHYCGATLVDASHVVTAAHCV